MSWAAVHGVVLGLPLLLLTALCVTYVGKTGEGRPWLARRAAAQRWLWLVLVALAWVVPWSGLLLTYTALHRRLLGPGQWKTLALPWMASWGLMVPMFISTCAYLMRHARQRLLGGLWSRRALWGLMWIALGTVLLAGLLGSLTAQGVFYR